MSTAPQLAPRTPNPFAVLVRIVFITLAFGILGLALGGFFGILAIVILNYTGHQINMYMALFWGGLPAGVLGLFVGVVLVVRSEWKALRKSTA